jgi:hypothetical protein
LTLVYGIKAALNPEAMLKIVLGHFRAHTDTSVSIRSREWKDRSLKKVTDVMEKTNDWPGIAEIALRVL